MEKKGMKRVWAGFLAAVMALGLVSFPGNLKTALADPGDSAGAQTKTVNLQIDGEIAGITDPSAPVDDQAWSGTKVYFGKYNNIPWAFRVLDAKTTDYSADGTTETMLLDSDTLISGKKFNDTATNKVWAESTIRPWLQGTGSGQFLNQFNAAELNAVIESYKAARSATDGANSMFAPLDNEQVFILDYAELKNTSYGYSDTDSPVSNRIKKLSSSDQAWWTRSPSATQNGVQYVRYVTATGQIGGGGSSNVNSFCISPAVNLDLASILFTSASGQSKATSFAVTEDSAADTWNLTLAGGTGFAATLNNNAVVAGEEIIINVTDLGTMLNDAAVSAGYYSQLSAMLVDEDGTVLAYGKISDTVAAGNVSFTAPVGIEKGTYTLKVFAEKVNSTESSGFTDYASNMVSFALTFVGAKNISLQVNGKIHGITNPSAPAADQAWSGTKVYFGKYANNPVLFRVLDANTTDYSADGQTQTMLLDSDALLVGRSFDNERIDNSWQTSDLKIWLQGTGSGQFLYQFSATERGALIASNKAAASATDGASSTNGSFSALVDDNVFVLDIAELKNTSYGYSNSETAATNRIKKDTGNTAGQWWTRSPLKAGNDNYVSFVHTDGKFSNANITGSFGFRASPAMNLDLSSILYATASGVDQTTALTAVDNDLVAANTWKLTLADESKTVGIQHNACVVKDGTTVTVPYTYAGSDISQLSIMITSTERTDAAAEVLYYGKLVSVSDTEGSGSETFTLPAGLPEGYKVYLLAEDINDGNLTNYASEPVELGFAIAQEHTADFAAYRSGETMEAPAAPSGCIFAGWYYDAECVSSPVPAGTTELTGEEQVYAKFVPETVLGVKAQITANTTAESATTSIRFVSTVDNLKYEKVGFKINIDAPGKGEKIVENTKVYSALYAVDNKEQVLSYTPGASFCINSNFFYAYTIKNVPQANFNTDFTVTPYWVTLDGTTVWGEQRTLTIQDVIDAYAAF